MKLSLAVLPFLLLTSCCHALFREEAGSLDFLIATAGHGPTEFVHAAGDSVITSDTTNDGSKTSCHVASRRIDDGSLRWRRNVCSSSETTGHVLAVSSSRVFTLDHDGSVRCWSLESGALLWDALVAPNESSLSIEVATKDSIEYVLASSGSSTPVVFEAATGKSLDTPSAKELNGLKSSQGTVSRESYCSESSMLVTFEEGSGSLAAWLSNNGRDKSGDRLAESESLASSLDPVKAVTLLSCSKTAVSVLLSTFRGTTAQVTFTKRNGDYLVQTVWQSEEGLALLSSGLMVDASHYVGDIQEVDEKELLKLSNRLQSQWEGLSSIFSQGSQINRRDHIFGFVKVAVLLSSTANRIFGLSTSGSDRGEIRYKIDLPTDCDWHRLIHGTSNSQTGTHGMHGASHNREVLVLSSSKEKAQWRCFEGSNGALHSKGEISLSSRIVQVVPLLSGFGPCRQSALLVLKDGSVQAIPGTTDAAEKLVRATSNGLYTHTVDKEDSKVTAIRIIASDSGLLSTTMGTAVFAGEEIVNVAYPSREEVVKSPCNVLGDDSLLLKYLNPHLAVFITKAEKASTKDEFAAALKSATKTSKTKRKPAGVSPDTTEPDEKEAEPNLFVNIVDTVSGRILYRASHSHATWNPPPHVIISENWVIYSFVNEKTRHTELGVLSLYEGMIDSKGVTAFTSPDQTTTFSSLDARDSKPVVLAKTYVLTIPATAMSMSLTREGISTRKLVLALLNGQITTVDRKVLDPRRPVGQVKDSEKKEGLMQYNELIPIIPYLSLSYNQTVESVSSIITSPTDLESQSLVLAFGGSDIFFARTSPSRGFDLLPDSFNRVLLSLVVAAMLIALVVVRGMVAKKVQKQGWV